MTDKDCPLVVDLDGTITRTDSLYESLPPLVGSNFRGFLKALFSGRLTLKNLAAPHACARAANFPLNQPVIDYLEKARQEGRKIYLATASPRSVAMICARRLGLFEDVFASSDRENLRGETKARLLRDKFGSGKFDYLGDSPADIPVWKCARRAIVANPRLAGRAAAANPNLEILEARRLAPSLVCKAMRIGQWIKNLLVFIPMILAHSFSAGAFGECLLAFFSFSLCSSSIYIINDLCDLDADRRHPQKKLRPFASGAIRLQDAPPIFLFCLAGSALLALFLPPLFLFVLFLYFCLSLAYSLFLKKLLFMDVIVLAVLYTLRLVAGGTCLGHELSNWLTGFAGFFFLGLALFKRAGALNLVAEKTALPGRGYQREDRELVGTMAICSGFCAIIIVALYIDSLKALELYGDTRLLWLICPLLLYWYGRLAILVHRGKVNDDPLSFAITDRVSWLVLGLLIIVFLLAS